MTGYELTRSIFRPRLAAAAALLALLTGSGCAGGVLGFGGGWSAAIEESLQSRLGSDRIRLHHVQEDYIHARRSVPKVYSLTGYEPIWIDERGPGPQAAVLLERIGRALDEGLDPEYYHRQQILQLLRDTAAYRQQWDDGDEALRRERIEADADLELLLTDAFLLLASHLHSGRISARQVDYEWYAERKTRVDLPAILLGALEADVPEQGPHPLVAAIDALAPKSPAYLRLKEALARYRALLKGGGLPSVLPDAPGFGRGRSFAQVPELRRLLQLTGDYNGPLGQGRSRFVFDARLEIALRRFQERHGLRPTGVLDEATLRELNEPVERRILSILINLERWRWLPADLGERYVIVNIADFSLEMFERDRTTARMRVVVGKQYRRTPVFSSEITHVVLNPPWSAPESIVTADLLPIIRQDPSYLVRHGFDVFEDGYYGKKKLDPLKIEWDKVDPAKFPYYLRQRPGRLSALGRFKFDIPNPYSVYLHDTPSKGYFEVDRRDFSSGCIRLEKPLDLAVALLGGEDWPASRIISEVNATTDIRTRVIKLRSPVPVHLLYWTAWVTPSGAVQFRTDIYDRDSALVELVQPRLL